MMKWVMLAGTPAIVAGGLYLKPPGGTSETYPRSAAETAFVLQTLQPPSAVNGMIDQLPQSSITRDYVPNESLTIYFNARGKTAAKFIVEMKAVDEGHTRLRSRLVMSGDADDLMKARVMPMGQQFAVVGRAALTEALDARMERREINPEVIKQAFAGYAVANMGAIQQGVADALTEGVEQQRLREAQREAHRGVMFRAGEPMVDASAPADLSSQ